MLRSLFTAVTALSNHQTFIDVVANNIANANTPGFKAALISFEEALNTVLRGGLAPTAQRGGVNPTQLGLGVGLSGINPLLTQGTLEPTGRLTDLAIQGDGFFILSDGQGQFFTRDGSFDIDAAGFLVNPNTGLRVQGWQAVNGVVDTGRPIGDLVIPFQSTIPAIPTTRARFQGNLDAAAAAGTQVQTTLVVYDSLGVAHNISIVFTKAAAPRQWTWTVQTTDPTVVGLTQTPAAPGNTIQFTATGTYDPANPATQIQVTYNNGANLSTVALDFTALTSNAQESIVNVSEQDGVAAGSLASINITSDGQIQGVFSNGRTQVLGQIALARFVNPAGLQRLSHNLYAVSPNSGLPLVGLAGQNGFGTVASGQRELSNVNLVQEFTHLIAAQRGFQANARVITTADDLLQEVIGLKR